MADLFYDVVDLIRLAAIVLACWLMVGFPVALFVGKFLHVSNSRGRGVRW